MKLRLLLGVAGLFATAKGRGLPDQNANVITRYSYGDANVHSSLPETYDYPHVSPKLQIMSPMYYLALPAKRPKDQRIRRSKFEGPAEIEPMRVPVLTFLNMYFFEIITMSRQNFQIMPNHAQLPHPTIANIETTHFPMWVEINGSYTFHYPEEAENVFVDAWAPIAKHTASYSAVKRNVDEVLRDGYRQIAIASHVEERHALAVPLKARMEVETRDIIACYNQWYNIGSQDKKNSEPAVARLVIARAHPFVLEVGDRKLPLAHPDQAAKFKHVKHLQVLPSHWRVVGVKGSLPFRGSTSTLRIDAETVRLLEDFGRPTAFSRERPPLRGRSKTRNSPLEFGCTFKTLVTVKHSYAPVVKLPVERTLLYPDEIFQISCLGNFPIDTSVHQGAVLQTCTYSGWQLR